MNYMAFFQIGSEINWYILKEVLQEIKTLANQKGLNILYYPIDADPRMLRQILINLLDNAIKFTKIGDIRINLKISSENEKQYLLIEVIDSKTWKY